MTDFYLYENWVRDRCRLHRGECRFCNDGQGFRHVRRRTRDSWEGPFELDEALLHYRQAQYADSALCRCMRRVEVAGALDHPPPARQPGRTASLFTHRFGPS
jgi:F-type H+-transporting ATPase subunit beta